MNDSGDTQCKFCDIALGRLQAAMIYHDRYCMAFLDTRPLFPGHTLLIPRGHYQTISDLPAEMVMPLFSNLQCLSRAVEEAMEAEGTFVAMNNRVSQSVPHLHVHIVPRRRHDGLKGFFWPRQKYADEREMELARLKIVAALERVG